MNSLPKALSDADKYIINIKIEEYKTLRAESLQSMANRNSILAFGLATLGLVFHAGVSTMPDQGFLAFSIFTLALPILSMLVLILWIGEAERMSRVGLYIKQVEGEINQYFGDEAKLIYWETWLREAPDSRKKTQQLLYPYYAIVVLFFGIAVFSPMYIFVFSEFKHIIKFIIIDFIYLLILVVALWSYHKGKSLK